MEIRKATKSDKGKIQILMNELNVYRGSIFSQENQEFHERTNPYPLLEDRDFDECLMFVTLDDDSELTGFIQGSIHQRKNHKLTKLGYIDELYVKLEYRGKGFAKALFLILETEFKESGCDHMTTHTDIENNLSQEFYTQAGMSRSTVELWKKL